MNQDTELRINYFLDFLESRGILNRWNVYGLKENGIEFWSTFLPLRCKADAMDSNSRYLTIIRQSFRWVKTKEGGDFWFNISDEWASHAIPLIGE